MLQQKTSKGPQQKTGHISGLPCLHHPFGRTVEGGAFEDVRLERLLAQLGVIFAARRLQASAAPSVVPVAQLTLAQKERLLCRGMGREGKAGIA